MTLSTTAIAKLTSATIRIEVPRRASIRPVAIPAIATTRQTTAIRAKKTAAMRTPSFLAGSSPLGPLALSSLRASSHDPIHLHDIQALAPVPAGPRGPHRHLALVPSRREDRRAGLQRRRQVDAAADHGRARHGVRRAGPARARSDGRSARAGANPRSQ